MDELFLLILSNLLHLHNSIDPTTSLYTTITTTSSPSPTSSPSSSTPNLSHHLFLRRPSSLLHHRLRPLLHRHLPPQTLRNHRLNLHCLCHVRLRLPSPVTEHIWSLKAPLRDTQ